MQKLELRLLRRHYAQNFVDAYAYEICGLGFLCRKILAFCLCEIFELLFRHGLSHLFRRAFQAGFLEFPPLGC